MRNFLLKTVFATFCFSLVFAFLSCDGIAQKIDGGGQDTESEQEFIITGTLSVDGAVPSEIARSISGDFESGRGLSERSARTAIPSIPSSTTYTVTATSGGKTEFGEVNGNSFTIKLSSGTWTVKAEGFSDSARNTKILEGQTQSPINISPNTVANNISITLSPISSGNGSVSLPISVADDSGIQSAIVKIFEDVGETKQITVNTTLEYDFSATKNHTISASVTAGSRYFVFTFYSVNLTAAKQNPNQNIAYQAHEVVNVFQNLETSIWQKNDTYLENGQFLVTKARADTFNRKEFYVKGTGSTLPGTASDTNSGTYFDPFATIQKAVGTINAINDETSAYTIKVDGTLEITSDTATSAVIIQPTKPLTLTIEGVNASNKATVKAKSTGDMRVFIVGNGGNTSITPNVTMKNLIITGGRNESGGGGGIRLEAGNLTLSNVEVTNNSTTYGNGGGIYVGLGNCTINGGTISNNSAESNGGGIYVGGGTLTINGTNTSNATMSGNQLTGQQKTGTAIFVGRGATAELDGSSGNVSITPGIAPGGALPTIYLEKGQPGVPLTGGSVTEAKKDAVLKLGGDIQIGTGNGTGIKLEGKADETKTNIKITAELTSTQIINISYADAASGKPIIEGENYTLTQNDCDKFSFDNSAFSLLLLNGKGIIFNK